MVWWLILLILFASLMILLLTGLPVAFAFIFLNMVGVMWFWGGGVPGFKQLILSLEASLTTFTMVPLVLFVLMGEIMLQSGVGSKSMDVVDKWLGKLPGRLSVVSVGAGTLFSALSGSAMATTAMLGSVLVPQMEERGYKKQISMGPLMASGGIAMLIPPSALAVFLASVGEISVAAILMAGIVPGLILAAFYFLYIVIRCAIQRDLAPSYELARIPFSQKLLLAAKYILPLAIVIFLVIGTMLIGIATPSESAALGAFGSFVLALVYRGVNGQMLRKTLVGTMKVSVMLLMIIAGSTAFSQILSFSGASRGLVQTVTGLNASPLVILIGMQLIIFFLGCFMEPGSIIMITIPIFMPIVKALGIDPVWFGAISMVNLQLGFMTPPFGLLLFTMKGVAAKGTTMKDVYAAAVPFLVINVVMIALMILIPKISLWLPGVI